MNSIWENYLDLAYGLMRNGNAKVNDPASTYYGKKNPFIKNEDKLVFTTKYGRKINEKLNYTALFNLNTQMFQGWAKEDIYSRIDFIFYSQSVKDDVIREESKILDPANWNDASDHRALLGLFR